MSILNTDMKRELEHLAKFLHMAVDYKTKLGFGGQLMIEPKPHEPTSHQYDFDCANSVAFLKTYGLDTHFKFNVETNHATLARHTMTHELVYASSLGMLGSIDANRGDLLLGWDTDQFPTDLYLCAQVMLVVLGQGGLGSGGLNFDAKVRRESFEPVDLFHAHVGAMDAFAQGLKIAAAIRKDGVLKDFVKQRYASWDSGVGAEIEAGKHTFETLETYMLGKGNPVPNTSGRQEYLENVFNRYFR
jgi:xylose isomerase